MFFFIIIFVNKYIFFATINKWLIFSSLCDNAKANSYERSYRQSHISSSVCLSTLPLRGKRERYNTTRHCSSACNSRMSHNFPFFLLEMPR